MFIKEDEPQTLKEHAVLLAIRNNMALFDRGLEVHAVKQDGTTIIISRSNHPDKLWEDALRALKKTYNKRLFNY